MPSRTPRPDERDRHHLGHRHRGHEGERRRRSARRCREGERRQPHRREHRRSGRANAVPSTPTTWRGSWRSRSTPTCTAPMKRIQFSCSAKRPASLRVAGEEEDHPSATRVAPAMSRATHAVSDVEQVGSIANPSEARAPAARRTRSAVRAPRPRTRSSDEPVCFDARLTRSTSPPIVDGSTLPDELPGEVVLVSVRSGTWTPNTVDHPLPAPGRRARTPAVAQAAAAAASNAQVPRWWSGAVTSRRSRILVIRTARRAALTTSRTASMSRARRVGGVRGPGLGALHRAP